MDQATDRPALSKLTVPVLKDLCRNHGLTVGGYKQALLDRLSAFYSSSPFLSKPVTNTTKSSAASSPSTASVPSPVGVISPTNSNLPSNTLTQTAVTAIENPVPAPTKNVDKTQCKPPTKPSTALVTNLQPDTTGKKRTFTRLALPTSGNASTCTVVSPIHGRWKQFDKSTTLTISTHLIKCSVLGSIVKRFAPQRYEHSKQIVLNESTLTVIYQSTCCLHSSLLSNPKAVCVAKRFLLSRLHDFTCGVLSASTATSLAFGMDWDEKSTELMPDIVCMKEFTRGIWMVVSMQLNTVDSQVQKASVKKYVVQLVVEFTGQVISIYEGSGDNRIFYKEDSGDPDYPFNISKSIFGKFTNQNDSDPKDVAKLMIAVRYALTNALASWRLTSPVSGGTKELVIFNARNGINIDRAEFGGCNEFTSADGVGCIVESVRIKEFAEGHECCCGLECSKADPGNPKFMFYPWAAEVQVVSPSGDCFSEFVLSEEGLRIGNETEGVAGVWKSFT
ncbi:hypothetical protein HK098_001471 [Nowakowskiella sp. JEL0407]|nr:hypothetical protein HK098_001471 [Nowakowskiella sp. JEL0407]